MRLESLALRGRALIALIYLLIAYPLLAVAFLPVRFVYANAPGSPTRIIANDLKESPSLLRDIIIMLVTGEELD